LKSTDPSRQYAAAGDHWGCAFRPAYFTASFIGPDSMYGPAVRSKRYLPQSRTAV